MTVTGFAAAHGAQIYYEVHGRGEPLVLLHGNSEDSRFFAHQIPFFKQRYKVIAIDSRAHGRSTRGPVPLDFYTMAGDVLAVLDNLGIDKAHLFGFSDGGNLALHVALTAPERVAALIVLGANLSPGGIKWWSQAGVVAVYGWLAMKSVFSKAAKTKKACWGLMVHQPKLTPADMAAVQAPTLVMAGDKDLVRDTHTRAIAAAIPHAELYIIVHADHFVAAKKPNVVNGLVERFLKKTAMCYPKINTAVPTTAQ